MVETSITEELEFNPFILEVLRQQKWTRRNNMLDRTILRDSLSQEVAIGYTTLRDGVDDKMRGLFTRTVRVKGAPIIEFRPRNGKRSIDELSTAEVALAVT